MTDEDSLKSVATFFKALSSGTRLRILATLCEKERAVSDIAQRTGYPQPKISRNLAVLRRMGIVTRQRRGHYVYYGVAERTPTNVCKLIASQLVQGRRGGGAAWSPLAKQ